MDVRHYVAKEVSNIGSPDVLADLASRPTHGALGVDEDRHRMDGTGWRKRQTSPEIGLATIMDATSGASADPQTAVSMGAASSRRPMVHDVMPKRTTPE